MMTICKQLMTICKQLVNNWLSTDENNWWQFVNNWWQTTDDDWFKWHLSYPLLHNSKQTRIWIPWKDSLHFSKHVCGNRCQVLRFTGCISGGALGEADGNVVLEWLCPSICRLPSSDNTDWWIPSPGPEQLHWLSSGKVQEMRLSIFTPHRKESAKLERSSRIVKEKHLTMAPKHVVVFIL